GIVGESGSGKTVASLTTLGLTRRQGARISGRILFEGRDLLALSEDELRKIRGNEIAMIFQDPLSSLHPFYKVGAQLVEVIITHDLGVVAEMADDIAVMYAGRIVETASAQRLFSAPEHPYTWGLLKSIPKLDSGRDEDLVPIPGTPPSLINRPSGCHFHVRCFYAQPDHARID